jgi:hypothetical protein
MPLHLSRRHVLRGLAATIALPFLEAMVPSRGLLAADPAAAKPPLRLVWLYAGSGMYMPAYQPSLTGRAWSESKELVVSPQLHVANKDLLTKIKPLATLEPLLPFKDDVSILTGLYHRGAFTRGTVVRHGQDPMCHLTGVDLFRVPGVASRNGVSIDQVAARHLGMKTRIPSLSLTHDRGMTISYTETGSPIPATWNPYDLFSRLFSGASTEDRALAQFRHAEQQSVLDHTLAETRRLHGALGTADRERLDAYLTHLREIEARAVQSMKWQDVPLPTLPAGATLGEKRIAGIGQTLNSGTPQAAAGNFGPRIRLMLDVLVLALQTDQTRIATAILGHMSDVYKEEGLNDAYHGYTHTGPLEMAKVDRLRIGHVAYLLGKLKAIREADGSTLLDNALIHFGGGMGSWHEATDLPNLIAGHGGGRFKLAEHTRYTDQPLANLYLLMLKTAGAPVERFADSTGALALG